ncbi:MAG: response regulator [Pirellulales bacterium]|nr:response regulator [Pirellulales bacterium]|tara:strand:- start:433 stop:1116 length:684 start_codon:yes stop_codon:yes gene_type:complete
MAGETILIIEDEPTLIDVLTYNLESQGYIVHSRDNGIDGLAAVKQLLPDLVLLDLMLPGLDGLAICRNLKSSQVTQDIPIVMLTAKSEEIDELVGFQTGADDYVSKPFKVALLLARIKSLLRRTLASSDEKDILKYRGIVLDRLQYKALNDGATFQLTPTEFELLWQLMVHPGRAYSRYDLMESLMGDNTLVLERTIDVHIRALRKKLGDKSALIETVRGVGYRMHA